MATKIGEIRNTFAKCIQILDPMYLESDQMYTKLDVMYTKLDTIQNVSISVQNSSKLYKSWRNNSKLHLETTGWVSNAQ